MSFLLQKEAPSLHRWWAEPVTWITRDREFLPKFCLHSDICRGSGRLVDGCVMTSRSGWSRCYPVKPPILDGRGGDNRLFIEAVLWIARTGSP